MRVAITGADGFTGRYLQKALAARQVDVLPLTADLRDADAIDAELASGSFDGLIHLAAIAFVATEDWRSVYAVNQIGTFNLLEAMARHQKGARCIIASSAQIYGPQAHGLIAESMSPNPVGAYAVSKYAMELGAAFWGRDSSITVTRPFNYTGVGQEDHYLVPKIVAHFRARKPYIELGNIDVARDFGDVRAAVDAYVGLMLDTTESTTVNICTGQVTALRDVIAMATALTGHEIEVRVNPAFLRANDVAVLGGDATHLKTLLPNWSPIPLRETLRWMLSDTTD